MSDSITEVRTASGGGLCETGHVDYDEAVEHTRRSYQAQFDEAQAALADLDAGRVQVFHQRGIYKVRNRREVRP